jgi:hypothetical protein
MNSLNQSQAFGSVSFRKGTGFRPCPIDERQEQLLLLRERFPSPDAT